MPAQARHKNSKRPRPSRTTRPSRAAKSRGALLRSLRPLVQKMVDAAIEDRLDALDGTDALREHGEVPHDEFWKRRGL